MFSKPAKIIGYQPHMHNRGQAMCMEVIYPNGTSEMLSCVDRYNFGWHTGTCSDDDAAPLLPKGTILHQIGWHDNTAGNRWNPDPRNWAGMGSGRSTR